MIHKSMQTVLLRFQGGPLDGEQRQRSARADWNVMRYSEPAADAAGLVHSYAGARVSADQLEVRMQYLGLASREVGT